MHSRLRTAAAALGTAALVASGVLVTAQSASATAQASCDYRVVWPVAGVYESPRPDSVIVKDKHAGDIVGAAGTSCVGASWNEYSYARVTCDAAADGEGWMRVEALVRI
jgi:hypothetical protein